jgi:hypothetical protein
MGGKLFEKAKFRLKLFDRYRNTEPCFPLTELPDLLVIRGVFRGAKGGYYLGLFENVWEDRGKTPARAGGKA